VAIEYLFQLCTSTPPAALDVPMKQVEWHKPGVTAYQGASGLQVTVRADGDPDLVLEEPDVAVGFRLDKFADFPTQYAELVRVVVRLLTVDTGDAVLQQDYERLLLLRRGQDLTVSETFWTPELLELLPWKYDRRPMPYPED